MKTRKRSLWDDDRNDRRPPLGWDDIYDEEDDDLDDDPDEDNSSEEVYEPVPEEDPSNLATFLGGGAKPKIRKVGYKIHLGNRIYRDIDKYLEVTGGAYPYKVDVDYFFEDEYTTKRLRDGRKVRVCRPATEDDYRDYVESVRDKQVVSEGFEENEELLHDIIYRVLDKWCSDHGYGDDDPSGGGTA